jgi:hypothetical protein
MERSAGELLRAHGLTYNVLMTLAADGISLIDWRP